ncbi:4'-phosphopantetheinyl transferase superfamily protein [Dokdonella sp.]|uniref:4'-phosphopantetheinyl transferase family protein n=1 Tax=Dokdonella sp. TaxID=2291710 RepID=UPI001B154386|nr:4'-phosphopantetheinyl transferase superfamily protein [Dokdonella sp.]MBO9661625.1 4'-phosphopantetheinyl transferase superfamily protein [Dokdonella sp.]
MPPLDVRAAAATMDAMSELTATAFAPRDRPPPLRPDEIHVCSIALDATATPRAVTEAARVVLDRLLRFYAGTDAPIEIARGRHGKPYAPAFAGLDFNLSHAGHHVLLAFARGQALGVDLERDERRLSLIEIARRFFAADEADALERLPDAARLPCFLRLWTRKEAVLKALGQGLNFGLDRLAFAIDGDGEVGALHRIAEEAGAPADWRLCALAPAPGLVGALAWRGPERPLQTFTLPL